MTENEISKVVVDICFKIHMQYGPGLFEKVYEELFCYELSKLDIPFERQVSIGLVHESLKLDVAFRVDVLIKNKVLVELKSVEKLMDVHYKQVQTYLKLTNLKLGMLINFNSTLMKDGIHRVVNNL